MGIHQPVVRNTGTRLARAQPSMLARELNSFDSKVPIFFFSINIKRKVCLEIAVTSNTPPSATPGRHLSCPVRLLITQAWFGEWAELWGFFAF